MKEIKLALSTLLVVGTLFVPVPSDAQALSAAALRTAERSCRDGHGDANACATAGAHYLVQPGATSGVRAMELLGFGCDGGAGAACRAAAGAREGGRPDQRIARDLGEARRLGLLGCAAGDMPSCDIAERQGGRPPATTLQSIVDLHQTFDRTTTATTLRARCNELHGVVAEGTRPGGVTWVGCQIERYLGHRVASRVHVRVLQERRTVTEILVEANVHSAAVTATPEQAQLATQLTTQLLAIYQPRFGLTRDPASPSYGTDYRPTTPSGVSAYVGSDSFSITYDPRVAP